MGSQDSIGDTRIIPVKSGSSATSLSREATLNVEPLKSDSFVSADVKLALLHYHLDYSKHIIAQ